MHNFSNFITVGEGATWNSFSFPKFFSPNALPYYNSYVSSLFSTHFNHGDKLSVSINKKNALNAGFQIFSKQDYAFYMTFINKGDLHDKNRILTKIINTRISDIYKGWRALVNNLKTAKYDIKYFLQKIKFFKKKII